MASLNKKKILKNTTGSAIDLTQLGLSIPAGGQITIEPGRYYTLANEIGLSPTGALDNYILAGQIVVNDGVLDITPANGLSYDRAIDYLKWPDTAFNIRFLSDPERVNYFVSKNVQEAIEESKSTSIGNDIDSKQFGRQGTISDGTVLLTLNNILSDTSPDRMAFNSLFRKFSFTNSNNAAQFTMNLWKIDQTLSPGSKTLVWTENFSGRCGQTATDNAVLIQSGWSIWVDVTATGNPKPADLNVIVWMRQTS